MQAQGARTLETPEEPTLSHTFAALLQPQPPAASARPALWEAPDLEFVRTYWPSDTVPHPAIRLTPGTAGRLKAISKHDLPPPAQPGSSTSPSDLAALSSISSVSLRPLTLEELDQSLTLSGLKPETSAPSSTSPSTPSGTSPSTTSQPMPGPDIPHILTIAEDDFPGRLELAEQQRKNDNLAVALSHYRAVIHGAPHLIEKVIAALLASTGEGPEQAAVYRLLGDAYTCRGNYMEALEAYNRGLAISRGQ
jgi:tetratricopeptide (TPR) repeat protein